MTQNANPKVGEILSDGTIYAGTCRHSSNSLYTMPVDARRPYAFGKAQRSAAEANARKLFGHGDWRLPTNDELNLLWENRAAIGGFDITGARPAGWYWSSTHHAASTHASVQRFNDGYRTTNGKHMKSSVRLVRSDALRQTDWPCNN